MDLKNFLMFMPSLLEHSFNKAFAAGECRFGHVVSFSSGLEI